MNFNLLLETYGKEFVTPATFYCPLLEKGEKNILKTRKITVVFLQSTCAVNHMCHVFS